MTECRHRAGPACPLEFGDVSCVSERRSCDHWAWRTAAVLRRVGGSKCRRFPPIHLDGNRAVRRSRPVACRDQPNTPPIKFAMRSDMALPNQLLNASPNILRMEPKSNMARSPFSLDSDEFGASIGIHLCTRRSSIESARFSAFLYTKTSLESAINVSRGWSVSSDGQRILGVRAVTPESNTRRITVVENWYREFEKP